MRKKKDYVAIFEKITACQKKLTEEYANYIFCMPETCKWDYAIPENYTNYQDGFLFPDYEAYKGMPIFDLPKFGRMYLRWEVPLYALEEGEKEKYLCYNRKGQKITIVILSADMKNGNPSYFRFLSRVKKYKSSKIKEEKA